MGMTFAERAQRRRETIAANAPFRAAEKVRREAALMTCQCCFRKFLANTGLMAHHGYQRPGGGWQTASCGGARHLPFEVSRERLGEVIKSLEAWKGRLEHALQEVIEEKCAVLVCYSDYSKPRAWDPLWKQNRYPEVRLEITRENHAGLMAEHSTALRRSGKYETEFEVIKATEIRGRKQEIARLESDVQECAKRFAAWKQTHEWNSAQKVWAPL